MIRIAALALLSACIPNDEPNHQVQWLDYGVFVADVQPIWSAECGNPACHANATRPFSIYSPRSWRADPGRLHLDESLSEPELEHNYTVSCVLASETDRAENSLLLLKPLAGEAGVAHAGGVLFEGTFDRHYRIVLAWIEGRPSP